ncbi:dirigent protein 1-like [Hordeum vulgare]|nr:dirigent protein 1-like [Hordeum vulgare]
MRIAENGAMKDLSLHLVFEAGEYGGSSLAVKGRVDTCIMVRESIIVRGTGRFRTGEMGKHESRLHRAGDT